MVFSPMNEDAQRRQNEYEQLSLSFRDRHYVRGMAYCSCIGRGCAHCSGHGWRHTRESIAFGRGLNSVATDMNPYDQAQFSEWVEWGKGFKSRQLSEGARIRALFRLEEKAAQCL